MYDNCNEYLSSVKKIADIYAKVSLEPLDVTICPMHDLMKKKY